MSLNSVVAPTGRPLAVPRQSSSVSPVWDCEVGGVGPVAEESDALVNSDAL
jgi:hypothetical protein